MIKKIYNFTLLRYKYLFYLCSENKFTPFKYFGTLFEERLKREVFYF